MPNIEIDFQVKNKKRAFVFGGLAGLLLLYSIYSAVFSSAPGQLPDYESSQSGNISGTNVENTETISGKHVAGGAAVKSAQSAIAMNEKSGDIFSVNPFIEIKEFDINQNNVQEMAANYNAGRKDFRVPAMPHAANIPLPVIPGRSPGRTELPANNHPASPRQTPQGKIEVQGIAMGDNGNVAIMSDGRVVSEGDTYNDNRIAYIGGDGITFENGTRIKYE